MGKDDIESFDTSGTAAEVSLRWKKWIRSFNYFVAAGDITNDTRLKNLLLHKAGLVVQDIFDDLQDPLPVDQRPSSETLSNWRFVRWKLISITNQTLPLSDICSDKCLYCLEKQVCSMLRDCVSRQNVCKFDDAVDDHIRDQIVATYPNADVQRGLLSVQNLTLANALDILRIHESSSLQASSMTAPMKAAYGTSVDHIRRGTPSYSHSQRTSSHVQDRTPCTRCNYTGHDASSLSCPTRSCICINCKRPGHFAACCRSRGSTSSHNHASTTSSSSIKSQPTHLVHDSSGSGDGTCIDHFSCEHDMSMCGNIHSVNPTPDSPPIFLQVALNKKPLCMELDTGAHVTIIPESLWSKSWGDVQLKQSQIKLCTFSGRPLSVMGEANVDIVYCGQASTEVVVVVKEGKIPLFGRNWLTKFKLDWANIFSVKQSSDSVLDEFPSLFEEGLGKIESKEATIHLTKGAVPKCMSARPLPYAMKAKVDVELDRLIEEGILEPVEFSEWASPVVIVKKKDDSIRLCADFKVTLNQQIEPNIHPIPNPTDLLSSLPGSNVFSKLDLSQAYAQLPLSDESQKLCVISTHRGLFKFTRLPFGISSAPAIWQKTIEQIVSGIDGVVVYFDDILIAGRSQAEHDARLGQVLQRFLKAGLRLKRKKCELNRDRVSYLGFVVSDKGLHPDQAKVSGIVKAPHPSDVPRLQSFLGLVNFYNRFIPNASQLLFPLNRLLQKDVSFEWSEDCEKAFQKVKDVFSSTDFLLHYDPNSPVVVECDASPFGVGACLLQKEKSGFSRPVAFVSRLLVTSERNYSQIEREALSIVFAVKRLHQYLYGRHFTLKTAHKPLLKIFGEKTGFPCVTAARLERWAVTLSSYSYSIQYIKASDNVIADCLSRLPLQLSSEQEAKLVSFLEDVSCDPCQDLPINAEDVAKASSQDPTLRKEMYCVSHGWPASECSLFPSFYRIRDELSTESGCLMWANRVVIPASLRDSLLQELHQDHLGITKMKATARSFF